MSWYRQRNFKELTDNELKTVESGFKAFFCKDDGFYQVDDDQVSMKLLHDQDVLLPTSGDGRMLFWNDTEASWNYTETSELFWDDTNKRLGIGTASPSSPLHVSDASDILAKFTSSDDLAQINLQDDSDNAYVGMSNDNDVVFMGFNSGVSTGNLNVDSSGNVGIGTTSPSEKLEVDGKIALNDGGNSVMIGDGAGANDDASDNRNVFVGYQAGNSNTTGSYNTASGYKALFSNTTGNQNTASGYLALYSNTTGSNNTANGYLALYSNTTGSYNTASGYKALFSNTTGNQNTASGYKALFSNTTGNYNTASGMYALYSNTEGNYNTASGYLALYSNTTGNQNTASGDKTLYLNTTGSYNTANGYGALLLNTTGNGNTANGYKALYSNTEGDRNTANGYFAGYDDTTGSDNTFIGYNTGRGIGSGNYNTILGANVTGLDDDLSNTVIIADGEGNERIYVDNTGNVGIGTTNSKGKLHVYEASSGQSTPNSAADLAVFETNNNAGISILAPDGNIAQLALGSASDDLGATVRYCYDNALMQIGTANSGDEVAIMTGNLDEAVRITSDGKVGIGTTSPSTALHVAGEVTIDTINEDSDATNVLVETSGLVGYMSVDDLNESHTHDLGRYSLKAPANVDSLSAVNYRTIMFGSSTSTSYQMGVGWWNSVPTIFNSYFSTPASIFGWSGFTSNGFIAIDPSYDVAIIGGGGSNEIAWHKELIHSGNFETYLNSYSNYWDRDSGDGFVSPKTITDEVRIGSTSAYSDEKFYVKNDSNQYGAVVHSTGSGSDSILSGMIVYIDRTGNSEAWSYGISTTVEGNASAINHITGVYGRATKGGLGDSDVIGVHGSASMSDYTSNASIALTLKGVEGHVNLGNTDISGFENTSNVYSFYAKGSINLNNTLSGNYYGLYLESLSVSGTMSGTKYGVYQEDTGATNHFMGYLIGEQYLQLKEVSAPSNVASYGRIYVKSSDSILYFMDSSGTEYDLTNTGGSGSVTSVDMSVPTGFAISGNPITTSGTLALAFDTGYSLPTDTKQGQWDMAYGWGDHSAEGYLTGNQTITLSGDVTGSGTTAITTTIASNAVEASMMNDNCISGHTALTSGLSSSDELLISDAGVLKRMDVSVIETYMQNNLDFGSATIGGSIADTQIAVGSGADTISGSSNLTYSSNALNITGWINIAYPTGTSNILIGEGLGGSIASAAEYNVLIGKDALHNLSLGEYNVAIGYQALYYNTITGYNVGIGYTAGMYIDGGGDNDNAIACTYIGSNTRSKYASTSFETVIGAYAIGNGTNTVTLGSDDVTLVYMNENGTADIRAGNARFSDLSVSSAVVTDGSGDLESRTINDTTCTDGSTDLVTGNAVYDFVDGLGYGTSNVSVNNQADNRIVTATATTDILNAESGLTYNNRLFINSGGISVNTSSSTFPYQGSSTSVLFNQINDGDATGDFGMTRYGGISYMFNARANGTESSPTTVVDGDALYVNIALGYEGSSFYRSSQIYHYVDGTVSSGVVPGGIAFYTTNSSGTLVRAMTINSDQYVGIGTDVPKSNLDIEGSLSLKTSLSSSTGTTLGDQVVKIFNIGSAGDVTLPDYDSYDGRHYVVINADSSYYLDVKVQTGDYINGSLNGSERINASSIAFIYHSGDSSVGWVCAEFATDNAL